MVTWIEFVLRVISTIAIGLFIYFVYQRVRGYLIGKYMDKYLEECDECNTIEEKRQMYDNAPEIRTMMHYFWVWPLSKFKDKDKYR